MICTHYVISIVSSFSDSFSEAFLCCYTLSTSSWYDAILFFECTYPWFIMIHLVFYLEDKGRHFKIFFSRPNCICQQLSLICWNIAIIVFLCTVGSSRMLGPSCDILEVRLCLAPFLSFAVCSQSLRMAKVLLSKHTEDVPESKDNALFWLYQKKEQNSVNSDLRNPYRVLTSQVRSLDSSRSKMSWEGQTLKNESKYISTLSDPEILLENKNWKKTLNI